MQFSRSQSVSRDSDKIRSQVSFLSTTPRADLDDLVAWARAHGVEAEVGSYSDKEFYLDAPEAFVDFVIEAMTPAAALRRLISASRRMIELCSPRRCSTFKSDMALVIAAEDDFHCAC
jgi:hypothetical protein